jgi:hypothetical protein
MRGNERERERESERRSPVRRSALVVAAVTALAMVGATGASAASWSSSKFMAFASSTNFGVSNCITTVGNAGAGGYIWIAYTARYNSNQTGCVNLAVRYQFDVKGQPVPKQWSSWGYSATNATRSASLNSVNFYQSEHKAYS